jgi:hypothetical protein
MNGKEYYALSLVGCVGIISSLYYMRSRKKPHLYVTRTRDLPKMISLSSHLRNDGSCGGDEGDDHDGEREEEFTSSDNIEQTNIGFGTDPSWFQQENMSAKPASASASNKCDLLHTGSRGGKLVIVMVGLPGSGKTFMSRKISRFLRWISYRTRVYSLAKYRLEKYGAKNADFFDPLNETHSQTRVSERETADPLCCS